jgi:hypothetical protein
MKQKNPKRKKRRKGGSVMRCFTKRTIAGLPLMMLLIVSSTSITILCKSTSEISQSQNARTDECNIASERSGALKFSFMTENGSLYAVNLTLSNGVWRREFDNVTQVTEDVPAGDITYTYVYNWPNHPSLMRQGQLSVLALETREFIGYAMDPTQFVPRSKAFIPFEEVGSNANVSFEFDQNSSMLTMSGYVEAGKSATVAVVVDENTTKQPNYALKACEKKQGPWICIILGWQWHFNFAFSNVSIAFSEIDPSKVLVGFRRAEYNDAIIDTAVNRFTSSLWDLSGRNINMDFVFPQYAVTPGYYVLQPLDVSEEFARILLPLCVSLGNPIVLDYLAPKIAELQPFTFSAIAEYFFAKSSYSNLIHDATNRKMTLDVTTKTMRDWWGAFVLPPNEMVKKLTAYSASGSHDLSENYDYTVNHVGSYDVIAVRINSTTEQLALEYEPTYGGVGGIVVPVDKFGLLAPSIGLASTMLMATVTAVIFGKRAKRRKDKQ